MGYSILGCYPPYFFTWKGTFSLIGIKIDSLETAFNLYGRDNLVPIDFIKQQIFYAANGCQPEFVWEKEGEPGKITCWYLKSKTHEVYKLWLENRPGVKS